MNDNVEIQKFTLKKEERLCSKIVIDKLFKEGKKVYYHPFRFVFIPLENKSSKYPIQVVFSVPVRNLKNATDRNFIKRRMRESYRIEKHNFYNILEKEGKKIALIITYTDNVLNDYHIIHHSLLKGMNKTISKLRGSHMSS